MCIRVYFVRVYSCVFLGRVYSCVFVRISYVFVCIYEIVCILLLLIVRIRVYSCVFVCIRVYSCVFHNSCVFCLAGKLLKQRFQT